MLHHIVEAETKRSSCHAALLERFSARHVNFTTYTRTHQHDICTQHCVLDTNQVEPVDHHIQHHLHLPSADACVLFTRGETQAAER